MLNDDPLPVCIKCCQPLTIEHVLIEYLTTLYQQLHQAENFNQLFTKVPANVILQFSHNSSRIKSFSLKRFSCLGQEFQICSYILHSKDSLGYTSPLNKRIQQKFTFYLNIISSKSIKFQKEHACPLWAFFNSHTITQYSKPCYCPEGLFSEETKYTCHLPSSTPNF